jgi:hypothetical protein
VELVKIKHDIEQVKELKPSNLFVPCCRQKRKSKVFLCSLLRGKDSGLKSASLITMKTLWVLMITEGRLLFFENATKRVFH